jgi:peptidase M23-like protein
LRWYVNFSLWAAFQPAAKEFSFGRERVRWFGRLAAGRAGRLDAWSRQPADRRRGEAYLSIFGSNESVLRQPGDSVRAGETVATAGTTGGSPESGLYFELTHLGSAFDPLRRLKRN